MFGIIDENVIHAEELRLVVLDDAGIRGYCALAVRECVESVDGLVRRNVIGKMNHEVCRIGRHILDLLNLDFSLGLGLEYGLDEGVRGLAVRYLLDSQCILVYLVDSCTYLHDSASLTFHIFRAVCHSPGREVGQKFKRLSPEIGDGGVDQLVEVVRENLGCHAHGNALGSLCQQERESYRQLYRLLVPSVIGGHPAGYLRVEDDFLGELAQPRLDVSCRSIGVSGKDVSPVSLTVHGEAFLTELDEGSEYGLVTVRVVLHCLTDNVCHLGETSVIHLEHGVQNPSLYRLEAVHDIRNGSLQDDV